jgi:hypothetical protein
MDCGRDFMKQKADKKEEKWALRSKAQGHTQQKTALNACEDVQMRSCVITIPPLCFACSLARSLARLLRLALFVVVQQQQHSPACSQPFFFFLFLAIYIYSQKVILKLKSTKINCIFNNYFQYPLLEKKNTLSHYFYTSFK